MRWMKGSTELLPFKIYTAPSLYFPSVSGSLSPFESEEKCLNSIRSKRFRQKKKNLPHLWVTLRHEKEIEPTEIRVLHVPWILYIPPITTHSLLFSICSRFSTDYKYISKYISNWFELNIYFCQKQLPIKKTRF